jgi:hypothetical protein
VTRKLCCLLASWIFELQFHINSLIKPR